MWLVPLKHDFLIIHFSISPEDSERIGCDKRTDRHTNDPIRVQFFSDLWNFSNAKTYTKIYIKKMSACRTCYHFEIVRIVKNAFNDRRVQKM